MATMAGAALAGPDFLSRDRIVATSGFNRWLVPPAALCIHLCIGMAYGFSVFWKPLQAALVGADGKPLPECSAGAVTFAEKSLGTLKALTATDCNWSQFDLGWMYTFFFVLLVSLLVTMHDRYAPVGAVRAEHDHSDPEPAAAVPATPAPA